MAKTLPAKLAKVSAHARHHFRLVGRASWYGVRDTDGLRTASGETFNSQALTGASPTLPFGTMVKVTNLLNGLSTKLRINDRGPFSGGRIIDVSHAAAKALGMMARGVARVSIEPLGSGASWESAGGAP